jgi:hypothetical protein
MALAGLPTGHMLALHLIEHDPQPVLRVGGAKDRHDISDQLILAGCPADRGANLMEERKFCQLLLHCLNSLATVDLSLAPLAYLGPEVSVGLGKLLRALDDPVFQIRLRGPQGLLDPRALVDLMLELTILLAHLALGVAQGQVDLDASEDLRQLERLGDVVGAADGEAAQLVFSVRQAGRKDNRDVNQLRVGL